MLSEFTGWVEHFEAEARRREHQGDPQWTDGAELPAAVVRSVQRFQVGEAGDGANLIAKAEAAGDEVYAQAVRMFVDEERNHARLLENLLGAANAKTIGGHWTDAVFVRLRRALGLRLELMVLMIAEVIALRYYRALRDGTTDPLTTEVAGRILADEQRHVPFHLRRLAAAFAPLSPLTRLLVHGVWRLLLLGAVVTVSYDHGPALRQFGLTRREFVADVLSSWSRTAEIHDPVGLPDRAVG
ncbi:ferritin-like domain-containing protein [Amycolatopsis sp. 195334CR]|uniref:ferritin-like domain-containing protein n=1 Tax=Amycolatopsis sp. 195334CR TaxID=2814588 RepID=UPI001A90BF60|nr:ferritin-like domain-containing protein [Amycolatopsis sp. 195334CR]MBN6041603.1 ferritin-like domain-containing protein [Amycolatopsis sp. 195334CR]